MSNGKKTAGLGHTAGGAGVGGALGFLLVWLGPQWGMFAPPTAEMASALTAAFGLVFTGLGGLLGRYLPAPRGGTIKAVLPVALLIGLGLGGCASAFGPADTAELEAYRLKGEFGYVEIPAAHYAASEAGTCQVKRLVASLDATAYAGIGAAIASLEAGGDKIGAALAIAASSLESLKLEVLEDLVGALPGSSTELAKRSVILGVVAAQSIGEMRAWRRYIKAKLTGFEAEGRDPSEAEWAEVAARVEAWHAAIAAGGDC